MAASLTPEMREQLRRHIDTWRAAGPALEEIRLRELRALDTCEAVRQIFGSFLPPANPGRNATSGLVEQQALFARLRP